MVDEPLPYRADYGIPHMMGEAEREEEIAELVAAAAKARGVLRRLLKRESRATLTASANSAVHQLSAALKLFPNRK